MVAGVLRSWQLELYRRETFATSMYRPLTAVAGSYFMALSPVIRPVQGPEEIEDSAATLGWVMVFVDVCLVRELSWATGPLTAITQSKVPTSHSLILLNPLPSSLCFHSVLICSFVQV